MNYLNNKKNLYEDFRNRLVVADNIYKKSHLGESMNDAKRVVVATCLNNMNEILNEAFAPQSATQLGNFGEFKKFCFN